MVKKGSSVRVIDELYRDSSLSLRSILIALSYLCLFTLFDIFSLKFKELQGVVAWYPPAGLSYALLFIFGKKFIPVVMIAMLIDSVFIFRMPQPFYQLLLWALTISSIYFLATNFLHHRIHIDWQLKKLRDVIWLVATAVVASAILAVLSVFASTMSSALPRSEILRATFIWWVGETIGILTVTPFLFIFAIPWLKKWINRPAEMVSERWVPPRFTLIIFGQILSVVIMFYWVFIVTEFSEFRPMYLITLPLIWIAITHGLKGVVAAIVIVNFGASLLILWLRSDLAYLSEFELMMIINCIVGLLMGSVVTERRQAEEEVRALNAKLEERVRERTIELSTANKELEAFSYSVAHDLRTPLRSINGFSQLFLDKFETTIPEEGRRYLKHAIQATLRMGQLIDAMLDLVRLTRSPMHLENIDLSSLATEVTTVLARNSPQRVVEIIIEPGMEARGDTELLHSVLFNLLGNAWKFTSTRDYAHIRIGTVNDVVHGTAFYVGDDGVGFSEEYSDKLFIAFERLHSDKDFPGMGIGLATVQRIVHRHGGKVWAKGEADRGATFYFTIPNLHTTPTEKHKKY